MYDYESGTYVEPTPPQQPILNEFGKDLAHNLDIIFNAQDDAGVFYGKH